MIVVQFNEKVVSALHNFKRWGDVSMRPCISAHGHKVRFGDSYCQREPLSARADDIRLIPQEGDSLLGTRGGYHGN